MAFVKRILKFTFTLGNGKTFQGSTSKVLALPLLRASTTVVKAGGVSKGVLQAAIYGMTRSHMNDLSTLGQRITFIGKNSVTLEGGDSESGMGVIYKGDIAEAYADLASSPQACFRFSAYTGYSDAVKTVPATSIQGAADVADVMKGFAQQMGVTFENNGVSVIIPNQYYSGSLYQQAQQCAKDANISWIVDNGILAIWPMNGTRKGKAVAVNTATGLISYPSFTSAGIQFRTLFNPSIVFGKTIKMTSQQEQANGEWTVFTATHNLDCDVPHGKWESDIGCYNPKFPPPVSATGPTA